MEILKFLLDTVVVWREHAKNPYLEIVCNNDENLTLCYYPTSDTTFKCIAKHKNNAIFTTPKLEVKDILENCVVGKYYRIYRDSDDIMMVVKCD